MTHASLFSGIGGFDLAAEWAGWENLFNCEIDPFCQSVLKYHFPNAEQYSDIRSTDFTVFRGRIDVLSGGFPCQPFSLAGKRRGTEDERHLWPEMLLAIREIRPRWVVGENVFGILNWSGGLVFEQVCVDLEAEGYEVRTFILPAAGVGALHKRDRVWFVAHAKSQRHESQQAGSTELYTQERQGLYGRGSVGQIPNWQNFPTQPPVCGRDDGILDRMDGITFPRWRAESIKAYGNAIVPQVAYQIFETINEYEASAAV